MLRRRAACSRRALLRSASRGDERAFVLNARIEAKHEEEWDVKRLMGSIVAAVRHEFLE